jgi:hypothetical protein
VRDALVIGVLAAIATFLFMRGQTLGADFTATWRAANALVHGQNPYDAVIPIASTSLDDFYRYPLPAAMMGVPFVWLSPRAAASLFVGCGFALAAFGLSGLGHWRMGVLASAPAFVVFDVAQWAPLMLGAALVPGFGFLLACKPWTGAALFAYRPSWRTLWGGLAFSLVALALLPNWPAEWLRIQTDYRMGHYTPPALRPGGVLLLLALLRWRRPEARLVAVMACVPQNLYFYDQLPLMLVPSTQNSLLLFAFWSHLVRGVAVWLAPQGTTQWLMDWTVRMAWFEPWTMLGLYAPALAMLLRRPNEGPAPAWLETRMAAWPAWLRGRPAAPVNPVGTADSSSSPS